MINQTVCLVNEAGHKFMYEYDLLPFDVRKRLQNCKYNLCAYCVCNYAVTFNNPHLAIEYMEGVIEGKDMQRFADAALREEASKYCNWRPRYTPEYWDDREIDLKIKRDWYTQKIERYDPSYLIRPKTYSF